VTASISCTSPGRFFLLLAIVHFWWFEFGLERIGVWTFEIYLFVICYAALFFFLCALLFPDRMDEYSGFAEYFHSRQKWFYALLGALFLADLGDTRSRARSISARSAPAIDPPGLSLPPWRSSRCSWRIAAITAALSRLRSAPRSIGS
jgi:hypothetical protein